MAFLKYCENEYLDFSGKKWPVHGLFGRCMPYKRGPTVNRLNGPSFSSLNVKKPRIREQIRYFFTSQLIKRSLN